MIRIPASLYVLLIPVVFFGSCSLSLRPIWDWQERGSIRSVSENERKYFPVLARASGGKYFVAELTDLPDGASLVFSVAREEEKTINRDLNDSIGGMGNYRYFQIISEKDGTMDVSLEVPTIRDVRKKGWYSMKQGSIVPQRVVSYGPGFAFYVLPWILLAGLVGVALYLLFVRRRKKPYPGGTDNSGAAALGV